MTRTLIALLCSLALVATLPACKKSADSAGGTSASSSKSSGDWKPSGTYIWKQPEGSISITFNADGTCKMAMDEGGATEETTGKYAVNAEVVTVTGDAPESLPLSFTRRDDGNLECNFGGIPGVFIKQ